MKKKSDMRKNLSGGQNFGATISIFALAVAIILAAAYGAMMLVEENAHNAAEKLVSSVTDRIDSRVSTVESLTRETALEMKEQLDSPEGMTRLIHNFVSGNDLILGSTVAFEPYAFEEYGRCFAPYSWMGEDGKVHDRQLGEETDYYQEEWYAEAKAGGKEYWCEPYFDEGGAKIMMCAFSVPIIDESGKLKAVLTADIGLNELEMYINSIIPYEDSSIVLRSAKGNILVNTEQGINSKEYYAFRQSIIAQKEADSLQDSGKIPAKVERNKTVIVRGETDIGWSVELVLPISYLLHGNVSMITIVIVLLFITIGIVIFAYRFLRSIQDRATEEYTNVLEAIAARYDVMYRVDLERGKTDFIKGDEDARRFLPVFDATTEESLFRNFNKYYVDAVIHEKDRDNVRAVMNAENMHEVLGSGSELSVTYRAKRNFVDYVYTEMSMIKAGENKNGLATVIIMFKVVDKEVRKQLSDAEQLKEALSAAQTANEAKSNFLFSMSHDIRTPMNAIIGYTSKAMTHEDDSEVVNDCLTKIDSAGQQLLSLVNQVLQMARIESGTVENKELPVDVVDQAEKVADIIGVLAKEKNIEFTSNTENVVHTRVITDADNVNQIVLNVLSNAVKYTPEGGKISYSVSEKNYVEPGFSSYEIMVSDNGIGMSQEFLDHIFENFAREQNSTISGIQGAGLGMAIVKRLVDGMNGTIDIVSARNVGTTVTVSIPMRWNQEPEDKQAEAGNDAAEFDFSGRRILLVEDNEMNREIAQDILEDEGIIVETAEDGDIAVEMVKAGIEKMNCMPYDAILMDIQMPRMNGYEATRAIRALPPEEMYIPIIALSANAFEEDKQKSLEAGMDDHVAKPIDISALKVALAKQITGE